MSRPVHHLLLSVDEYLANEESSNCRHEYVSGQLYAMTGASDRHGLIILNIAAYLRPHLRGTTCQLFANDMKLRLHMAAQDIFYYPDLLLSCDPHDRATYYRTAPCLLIEVLSKTTMRTDQREKLFAYTTIPSLCEYVTIEQHERRVAIYRRATNWALETCTTGSLLLTCLNCALPLDSIYEDVGIACSQ